MARDFVKEIEGIQDRAADRAAALCDERLRKLGDWFSRRHPRRELKITTNHGLNFVYIDGEELDIDRADNIPLWHGRRVPGLKPIVEAMDEIDKMCDAGRCNFNDVVFEPKYAFSDYHFKPGDFNHKLAWWEWAKPKFDSLPADVRQLYHDIRDHYPFLNQDKLPGDTSVRWPTEDEEMAVAAEVDDHTPLRVRFDNVAAEWLMEAIPRVHALGHWGSGWAIPGDGGAYWKFESLAKQVLIEKNKTLGWDMKWDVPESVVQKYIVPTAAEAAVDKILEGTGLSRHSIQHVNFRPHAFVIGTKHLENSPGMVLDPNCAPCAMRGCNLSYDEHVSDHVLFVTCPGEGENVELTDEQKEVIKSLEPVFTEHGLDGVAFVRE